MQVRVHPAQWHASEMNDCTNTLYFRIGVWYATFLLIPVGLLAAIGATFPGFIVSGMEVPSNVAFFMILLICSVSKISEDTVFTCAHADDSIAEAALAFGDPESDSPRHLSKHRTRLIAAGMSWRLQKERRYIKQTLRLETFTGWA
ncbi:hypothetical protein AS149_25890 [Burkholderia cenocepacia]|nr:hypothetical protein AS149_25890 [Burkholderia cenocepacia]